MDWINFFDGCRFFHGGGDVRNKLLQKLRLYSIWNRIIDVLANIILPVYFRLTKENSKYRLSSEKRKEQIVVSFTSFPTRIRTLWLVVECLLRQTEKPDRVILYLSKEQFGSLDTLPSKLVDQQKRGLEIKLCEGDLRSHKKYFYAFQEYANDIVITVDDDIFYRTDLIETLYKAHCKHPDAIIANWAKEILKGTSFYVKWPDAKIAKKSDWLLSIGVSGVLYPPRCMYQDVCNEKLIQELSFSADDVWLCCMAILKNTPRYFTNYPLNHVPVFIPNNIGLLSVNRTNNQVCVDKLNLYYGKKLGIEPFIR